MDWDDIAIEHGTDKGSWVDGAWTHDYMPTYEQWLQGIDMRSILEIGVEKGASLRMWAEIFPEAKVVGVDIRPEILSQIGEMSEKVTVEIADATLKETAEALLPFGPFDLIVDDGSHVVPDVLASLNLFFGMLRPGGLYVIEDLLWAEMVSVVATLDSTLVTEVLVAPDAIGDRTLIGIRPK